MDNIITKIENIQNGDSQMLDNLIKKFDSLIGKYSFKLGYEDAKADLTLLFVNIIFKIKLDNFIDEYSEFKILKYLKKSIYNEYIRLSKINTNKNKQEYELNEDIVITNKEISFEEKIELKEAISLLSPIQRKIVIYKFFYGYSVQEIALVLNMSRQSVHKNVKKALSIIQMYWSLDN